MEHQIEFKMYKHQATAKKPATFNPAFRRIMETLPRKR
jgi:hypothetical protein